MKRKATGLLQNAAKRIAAPLLADRYAHVLDKTIRFDEEPHIYSVDWDGNGQYESKGIVSVTGFVHSLFGKFHADRVIDGMMASPKWHKSKYHGLTRDQIKAQWEKCGKDARELGTLMHKQIEDMYNGKPPAEPHSVEYKQFLGWHEKTVKLGWTPFRTEWMLRSSKEFLLTGTIDMLYLPRRRLLMRKGRRVLRLIMADWKRSKKIARFGFGKLGKGACKDLPDSNFFHYSLQLNTYKYMLERFYKDITVDGVKYDDILVQEMYLVVMHPETRKKHLRVPVPNYQKRIEAMVADRAESVKSFLAEKANV